MVASLAVLISRSSDAGPPLASFRVGTGGMSAECPGCRVALEQSPGADPRAALRGFLEAHPLSRDAVHSPEIPPGWLTREPSRASLDVAATSRA